MFKIINDITDRAISKNSQEIPRDTVFTANVDGQTAKLFYKSRVIGTIYLIGGDYGLTYWNEGQKIIFDNYREVEIEIHIKDKK